jgi:hypothetical protein
MSDNYFDIETQLQNKVQHSFLYEIWFTSLGTSVTLTSLSSPLLFRRCGFRLGADRTGSILNVNFYSNHRRDTTSVFSDPPRLPRPMLRVLFTAQTLAAI